MNRSSSQGLETCPKINPTNKNINGYLLKEAAERRIVITEIEKIEDVYSTKRE